MALTLELNSVPLNTSQMRPTDLRKNLISKIKKNGSAISECLTKLPTGCQHDLIRQLAKNLFNEIQILHDENSMIYLRSLYLESANSVASFRRYIRDNKLDFHAFFQPKPVAPQSLKTIVEKHKQLPKLPKTTLQMIQRVIDTPESYRKTVLNKTTLPNMTQQPVDKCDEKKSRSTESSSKSPFKRRNMVLPRLDLSRLSFETHK